jgi:hypothetical protein
MMSLLIQEWSKSGAWDKVLEQSYRTFLVQDILTG